jgi:methylenetetrahydrofolate reductase (NADPH)
MATIEETLGAARFEVLPLRGAGEAAAVLPPGTTVTMTASPRTGIEASLELAGSLAAAGMHAVPHLAARLVTGRAHLSRLLDRIAAAGIEEVFAIAGDEPAPAGPYPDALTLLREMAALRRRPARVGITGYPERHPLISDEATIAAMAEKSAHADYVVSQLCFAPQTAAAWVQDVRARGVGLPIYLGVPGAIELTKLLRISLCVGIGDSMRFLRAQHGLVGKVGKMLGRYSPSEFVDALAPYVADPRYGIAGWHLFTFNEIDETLAWRDQAAARTLEVPA